MPSNFEGVPLTNRLRAVGVLLALALLAGGCAAGQAFSQGDAASKAGDLDGAVAAYRRAALEDPDNPKYKIVDGDAAASRLVGIDERQFSTGSSAAYKHKFAANTIQPCEDRDQMASQAKLSAIGDERL
jgi:hypothetical protein